MWGQRLRLVILFLTTFCTFFLFRRSLSDGRLRRQHRIYFHPLIFFFWRFFFECFSFFTFYYYLFQQFFFFFTFVQWVIYTWFVYNSRGLRSHVRSAQELNDDKCADGLNDAKLAANKLKKGALMELVVLIAVLNHRFEGEEFMWNWWKFRYLFILFCVSTSIFFNVVWARFSSCAFFLVLVVHIFWRKFVVIQSISTIVSILAKSRNSQTSTIVSISK
jgi:hypothetical protein